MLFNILIVILVLGELVFFHELGHFLAAKACGIYCDRFSLGMPPRLFGIRVGETDYCIGLLPIGGYVKMAGQEDVPLSEDERKEHYGNIPSDRWYMNKPVWQRMIVIAAGPFMNVVLAVVLFAIVAVVGAQVPEYKADNRIGRIAPDSPAMTAPMFRQATPDAPVDFSREPDAVGWETGDRIVSIDGERIKNIVEDVVISAALSDGSELSVVIERTAPEGTVVRYVSPVKPRVLEGATHPRFGIEPYKSPVVDVVYDGFPAQEAGLQKGDLIAALNGEPIDANTFSDTLQTLPAGQSISLNVKREDQNVGLTLTPMRIATLTDVVFEPSLEWFSRLESETALTVRETDASLLANSGFATDDVIKTIDGQPASGLTLKTLKGAAEDTTFDVTVTRSGTDHAVDDVSLREILEAVTEFPLDAHPTVVATTEELEGRTGLQRHDIVETINGEPATAMTLASMEELNAGDTIEVTFTKPSILYGLVRSESKKQAALTLTDRSLVGIIWGERTVYHSVPAAQALPEALRLTAQATARIVRILELLVTGGVSPKELGGPIMIATTTAQAARMGYSWLLETTAFISVNLAIFNLLPLPVLDGGHLVFLAIEGVRRKPVSMRVMEWVQQAGLVFIIGLMLYVTWNDISRWFVGSFMP